MEYKKFIEFKQGLFRVYRKRILNLNSSKTEIGFLSLRSISRATKDEINYFVTWKSTSVGRWACSDIKIDPPIHTEYLRSGGAMILIFIVGGARAVISAICILSAIPGNMVEPPDNTVLAYKSLRMFTSHFMMELYVVSWIPVASIPRKEGWNMASGHLKRLLPILIT